MISITINGIAHTILPNSNISQLLEKLQLQGKPVVVELNQRAVLPNEHFTTIIPENANIEIVTLAAGG